MNIHFVADGKPWSPQNVTGYPMWLSVVRIRAALEWYRVASSLTPSLDDMQLTAAEQRQLGRTGLKTWRAVRSRNSSSLQGLFNGRARRLCRCFLRGLARDKKSDPSFASRTDPSVAGNESAARQLRADTLQERQRLLKICGGDSPYSKDEARRCQL
eukprot:2659577-Prymnesium_polylepis.3